MRISCQSDHHLDDGVAEHGESYLDTLVVPDVDVLIVPGDLASDHNLVREALIRFSRKVENVIYVPGNHEHDHKDIYESRDSLKSICKIKGVSILDDGFIDINGFRFIGSTLWSDCGDDSKKLLIAERIFKYWPIKYQGRNFSPKDASVMHNYMLDYIGYQLSEARKNDLCPIVISHHAPSKKSVHDRFLISDLNEAFYTDLSDFIYLNEPRYWFHGHMHHSISYKVGETNVICNPMGSVKGLNGQFDPNLVIEIGPNI